MSTVTDKASPMQKAESIPAGTYMAEAAASLAKIGVVLVNQDVRDWLEDQQAARVPLSEIALRWKHSDNARLARETHYVVSLLNVSEELGRSIKHFDSRRQKLSESLQSAGIEKVADIAVEETEALVDTAAQLKTFKAIKHDLDSRLAWDQPAEEIFDIMSRDVYNKLADTASSLRGRTLSWKAVAHTNSVLVALGDTAAMFLDVEKT